MKRKLICPALIMMIMGVCLTYVNAATWYVDCDCTAQNPNGQYWSTAFTTIDAALNNNYLASDDEIWVAEGTYTSQSGSIVVPAGVMLFGGFSGSENYLEERNWATHPTYLTGWWISASGSASEPSAIDGFQIVDGYLISLSGDVTFSHNVVVDAILGIDDDLLGCYGSVKLVNNLIYHNYPYKGEGTDTIFCGWDPDNDPILVNNTIVHNSIPISGVGVTCMENSPRISNNIIADCGAYGIYNSNGSPILVNNCVYAHQVSDYGGLTPPATEINDNPLFVDWYSDYHLLSTSSPCYEAGNNGEITTSEIPEFARSKDLDCRDRIQGEHVDIGAYEEDATAPQVSITSPAPSTHVSSISSLVIQGTAEDYWSGIDIIQVGFGTTTPSTWYEATYSNATGEWTYTCENPSQGSYNIWVRAYDKAGNSSEIYQPISCVGVVYVTPGGTSIGSWTDTYSCVQSAIEDANATSPKSEVWVAEGTYSGTAGQITQLYDGIAVYGGFAGGESTREERDWTTNETILDGAGSGSVVTIQADATSATIIDGFTIQNGAGTSGYGGGIYCSSGSPTISNNKIIWNYTSSRGGGIYIGGGSPTISYNIITGNEIDGNQYFTYGGGIYASLASGGTISNNVVSANGAYYGGGIYCRGIAVTNNTVVANDGREGGGICCGTSDVIKANIIAFNCSGIQNIQGGMNTTITYNCLYANSLYDLHPNYIASSATNVTSDPKLVGIDQTKLNNLTSVADMRIQGDSPCIDAVTDGTLTDTTDISGQQHNIGTYADIGAYESNGSTYTIPYKIYRVIGSGGSDDNDGSDWTTNAMATIQGAINKAAQTGGDVWVKSSTTFYERITLRPFVYLIGSCSTSTTVRPNRTSLTYGSVIDGQSQGRVITIRGGYRANLVDGFKITRGSIAGNGAGIYCSDSSPVIRYGNISGNSCTGTDSTYGGGIYSCFGAPEIIGNYVGESSSSYNFAKYGAGIRTYMSAATISRNYIRYNKATYDGGGIYADAIVSFGGLKIENNFINSNTAASHGSGIYVSNSGTQQDSLYIDYNTITANTLGTYGLYIVAPNWHKIINNIVYNNTGGIGKSGTATVTVVKNCVYGNTTGGVDYSSGITHASDINSSPQLGTWYMLNSNSPCINAADSSYTTSIDIENYTRPYPTGGAYDIGCYEYR